MKTFLLSILHPAGWTILGLLLSMAGVLLLFRFGMPYRLRAAEGDYYITETPTNDPWDKVYSVLGWIGLLLVLTGTGCQVVGAYLPNI